MGSNSNSSKVLELRLSLKPSYVPKTIRDLLSDLDKIDNDVEKKLSVLNDYLNKYKEELSRVEVLKRDLPQCMLLLMDAIEIIKDEITKSLTKKTQGGESEVYDHDRELQRRVSEFLACKKRTYENDRHELQMKNIINNAENKNINDLLTSSLISPPWPKCYHDQFKTIQDSGNKSKNPKIGSDVLNGGTSFGSRSNNNDDIVPAFGIGSRGGGGVKYDQLQPPSAVAAEVVLDPIWRNTNRRTWTPELHAKFIQAMGRFKSPEVATPKQIRELMNVKDLTNDQVKSHLQKYRLHLRGLPRSSTTDQTNSSDYRPTASAQYDHVYYRGLNNWFNPSTTAAAASHSNSAAVQGALLTTAASVDNEENGVVDNDEPADRNFGGWIGDRFGASGDGA
ncbi:GARP transcription factor [Trema orientale]|uniref:GARP transcription factor n=1 Tax=Trema orientale TaxID=63057 RepID=A0A2P5E985_TREOI|nr:GARP transcription factor [Trema orientale]